MIKHLRYNVYTPQGRLVAKCLLPGDAAAIVAAYGEGSTIRKGRKIYWTEGEEDESAGDSYDTVAMIVYRREAENETF